MQTALELEPHLTIGGTPYEVIQLEAREALDEIGFLRCEIRDRSGAPYPAALLDKTLVLELRRKGGGPDEPARWVAGYVVEAESTTPRGGIETGTVVVARPRLHRLTQRADCRVFQHLSAPDIVKRVLAGAGVPDQEWKLAGSYPARAYTTQYRETDFAFIQRVLSEEGIAFAVDGSAGKDVVVFFDQDRGDIEGATTIVYRPGDGMLAGHDAITAVSDETSTAPGKVNLRDYDFERPRLQLDAKKEGNDHAERSLEVYHHPGRFVQPAEGDRLAQVLLDALRARREMVGGLTNTLRLQPGQRFAIDEHPYAPINRQYLVLEVTLSLPSRRHAEPREAVRRGDGVEKARYPGDRIGFRAVPTAKTRYRPPRVARAVASPGAQVAVIAGPPGKEIHPDPYGRVKVHFPWDRLGKTDDTSSPWIRTCQLPLGGSMLTPRVGWEAYVNFTDGDPDRPFVFGRMYNAEKPPPYELPRHKTRTSLQTATTPGGGSTNEIRMDDKAGHEEMFMNASKDASVSAGNNATESIGNNETRAIGANQTLSVTGSMSTSIGASQSLAVGADQTIHVSSLMAESVGSHRLSIGGSRDVKAGGDHSRTVAGASTLRIGGMQIDLVAGSADESGLATMDDHIGAALVELTASNRTVTVSQARTEHAGAAKVIVCGGARSVSVGATLKQKVAGAVLTKVKGARADASKGDFLEVAGGAQIIKAVNVVFEAESLLSVVMGASTLTLTKASVSIAGTKITLDGDVADKGVLVVDNV